MALPVWMPICPAVILDLLKFAVNEDIVLNQVIPPIMQMNQPANAVSSVFGDSISPDHESLPLVAT